MKNIIFILIIIITASKITRAENYLTEAQQQEKDGNYAAAISNYINIINQDAGNYKVYNRIGILYQLLGKEDEAKNYFVLAIIANNEYTEGYFNIGLWYYKKEKYVEASINFKRAISISPENPDIYISLINCYIKMNELTQADTVINDIIKNFPNNHKILNLVGIIKLYNGKNDEAEKYFRQALLLNNDDKIKNNLAIALYLSGKTDEAKNLLKDIKKYDIIKENAQFFNKGVKK